MRKVGTCSFSNIHLNKIFKMDFNKSIKLHKAKSDFEDNFEKFETLLAEVIAGLARVIGDKAGLVDRKFS